MLIKHLQYKSDKSDLENFADGQRLIMELENKTQDMAD
jgi:hypothetical protein